MPQIVAFAGPAGPFFLFLPFFFPPVLSPAWMGLVFSHPGSPLSRIRPQLPHTPPTGPVTRLAGVVSLPGLQNRTQGHTGASLGFLSRTSSPLPLKGEGLGTTFLGSLGWPCSFTTAPRWPNRAGLLLCWCRSPTQPSKPHTGSHRAEFGFHRLFLVRFGSGRVDKSFSSL